MPAYYATVSGVRQSYRLRTATESSQYLRLLERFEIGAGYEFGNVIGGLYDVVEIESLMPHTQAGLLGALSLGSEVSIHSKRPNRPFGLIVPTGPASVRRNPPNRSERLAKTQRADRCHCRAAFRPGRPIQTVKVPGLGIGDRVPQIGPGQGQYSRSAAGADYGTDSSTLFLKRRHVADP